MNYQEILDFLFSSLPMYQRVGHAAYKANLDNTIAFDNYLGNPHRSFRSIHIAGTNGKGSVSHMLAALMQQAGYKTGLYTSPHLKDFRERIRINGEMISKSFITEFINENLTFIRKTEPSFFEMSVALAFSYFAKEKIDIGIIETGMGGRLDSTNIIDTLVSIITNISFDNTRYLGNTLEAIAGEKAGIIKAGVPVVIGEYLDSTAYVFRQKASGMHSSLVFASENFQVRQSTLSSNKIQAMDVYSGKKRIFKDLQVDLPGIYQRKNVPVVLQVIEVLNHSGFHFTKKMIRSALKDVKIRTGLRGRWDVISENPMIICDTCHNESGVKEVVEQLKETPYKKLHFVFGMVNDKDPDRILPLLPRNAVYYFTKAAIPRALEASRLKEYAEQYHLKGNSYDTVSAALSAARKSAGKDDLIFVGGSNFIVAEALP